MITLLWLRQCDRNETNNINYLFVFFFELGICVGSRHSSYTSHQSRISYTSHGDLLGTKEHKLKNRQPRNSTMVPFSGATGGGASSAGAAGYSDGAHKSHRGDYVSSIDGWIYPYI